MILEVQQNRLDHTMQIVEQMQKRTAPYRARHLIDPCKHDTRNKGIDDLIGRLVHQCKQECAPDHGNTSTVGPQISVYHTAEQEFLCDCGRKGYGHIHHDRRRAIDTGIKPSPECRLVSDPF